MSEDLRMIAVEFRGAATLWASQDGYLGLRSRAGLFAPSRAERLLARYQRSCPGAIVTLIEPEQLSLVFGDAM